MRLQFQLTDLDGTPKSGTFTGSYVPNVDHGEPSPGFTTKNGFVNRPLSDSRLGQMAVSMYEPAAALLTAADTAIKVFYGPYFILWGIVLKPSADFDAGVVTCSLHDSTIRFKHRNERYGDSSVTSSDPVTPGGAGIPVDGVGYRMIISEAERPSGLPPGTGVLQYGVDTVPGQPALVGGHPPSGALYVSVARGDNCWEDMQSMNQAADGFEADFRPFDADHASLSGGAWATGLMVELITQPLLGMDRSQGNTAGNDPVVFVHGVGGFHLVSEPDANSMCNYAVEVQPGGPNDPNDINGIAQVRDNASISKYGIWEKWGSSGQIEGLAVLANRGVALVTGGAEPPKFMTATCDDDLPCGYLFIRDFDVGDFVTVYAKRGYCMVREKARITRVQVNQKDSYGNTNLEIELVPAFTVGTSLVTG